MKPTVDETYQFVINESLGKVLGANGYERRGDTFCQHRNGIKKLVIIWRDLEHRRMAVFSLATGIFSDDYWQLSHDNAPAPDVPTLYSCLLVKRLGKFYGKRRPDKWLTVDALTNADAMVAQLTALLTDTLLPYLNTFNSLNDIISQGLGSAPSRIRMRLLTYLGRQEEARFELRRLIASRHQRSFREMIVKMAKADGLMD